MVRRKSRFYILNDEKKNEETMRIASVFSVF